MLLDPRLISRTPKYRDHALRTTRSASTFALTQGAAQRVGWVAALCTAALASCGQSNGVPVTESHLTTDELMDPMSCAGCHPKQYADWSGSMHAYASDDPLFRAMNQRGQREAAIGPFCVNCHAPLAVRTNATTDGLNLDALPAPMKGVTCYFCHAVDDVRGSHDNPLHLSNDAVMRGPFADPLNNPAHGSTYSAWHDRDQQSSSALCGTCHDLVNGHGVALERSFAEWQSSVFGQSGVGTTCGQCHMDRALGDAPVAEFAGAPLRRAHNHRFPAVDVALSPFADADGQRVAVQALIDSSLQSALCVRGFGAGATLQVILDNVAAGHNWPSGATQDRRAWVEVIAYVQNQPIYESGVVPDGASPTSAPDADLWLLRNCMFDKNGAETHMFWEAAEAESRLLPAQQTFDPSDKRYYQSHIVQTYPRSASERTLSAMPDRVTLRVRLQAVGREIIDDLAQSGDLKADAAGALALAVPTYAVGSTLEWTANSATETYLQNGEPVSCISRTNLSASADKVPAAPNGKCAP